MLFLPKEQSEFIPFFNTIDWNDLKDYKDAKNNCEKIDFEKLDLSQTTKNNKNIGKNIIPEKGDQLLQSTIIKEMGFKLKDKIENIEYEPYILDNRISGLVFESDITSGKVNMMRNKEYIYENTKYEMKFQIINLSLKHFLFFRDYSYQIFGI